MFKILSLCIALSLFNCMPTKGVDTKDSAAAKTTNLQKATTKEMIEKGFSKGTIVTSKSSKCPYVLNVEEFEDNLDPINLEQFFKDSEIPTQVWVKYAGLRMPNRCEQGRPVSILEIEMRSE